MAGLPTPPPPPRRCQRTVDTDSIGGAGVGLCCRSEAHWSFRRAIRSRILEALLASASAFGPGVRFSQADAGECHRNVAALWIDGAIESIGTGYALSDDQLWRQHSWGVDAEGVLVETTDERHTYVGIVLPERVPSMQFAGSNAQEHLKTVLRQRGPRSAELVAMIRELANVGKVPVD